MLTVLGRLEGAILGAQMGANLGATLPGGGVIQLELVSRRPPATPKAMGGMGGGRPRSSM
jgi:hypothetical protein